MSAPFNLYGVFKMKIMTTNKVKNVTKAKGNIIAIEYYLNFMKHKNNYNTLALMDENKLSEVGKIKRDNLLKESRLSAIENYKLAFCLN